MYNQLSNNQHLNNPQNSQHQHQHKIADPMYHVERDTGYPPGKSGIYSPAETSIRCSHDGVRQGTEESKQKSKHRCQNTPEPHAVLFAENPGHNYQKGPGIQIHNPPGSKPVHAALQQYKYRHYKSYLSSEEESEYDQPEGSQFNIRQEI